MRILSCSNALILAALLILATTAAGIARSSELDALNRRVSELADVKKFQEALPLAEKAVALAERLHGPESLELAEPLLAFAGILFDLDRPADAEPQERRALTIRQKALGPGHTDTAAAMIALAGTLKALRRLDEAATLYEQALVTFEATPGSIHPDVPAALASLASIYIDSGRHAAATPILERLRAEFETMHGPQHARTAAVIEALADLAKVGGQAQRAGLLYERALAVREMLLGAEHPDLAHLLRSLAEVYLEQKRYADAVTVSERMLVQVEKALGPNHLEVADAAKAMAQVRLRQGRFDLAEPLLRRNLAIREQVAGADHRDLADALNQLASLLHVQGRYAASEPLYKRVIAAVEAASGMEHPDLAEPLTKLAAQYVAQGRFSEAEPILVRGLAIREKAWGPKHARVAEQLIALSLLYLSQNLAEQAEPLLKRALIIEESEGRTESNTVLLVLNHLSLLYGNEGRYAEAEPLAQRALEIVEKTMAPDHPMLAIVLNNLSVILSNLGRGADSEALYMSSLGKLEPVLSKEHPIVLTLLFNLADLYRSQRRFAEAEPLLKRAIAMGETLFGPIHPQVATSLQGLAWMLTDQDRAVEAIPLLDRAVTTLEQSLGADDPGVSSALGDLANLYFKESDWARAVDHWRRSTGILKRRTRLGTDMNASPTRRRVNEAARWSSRFTGLVKAGYRLSSAEPGKRGALAAELFEAVQWAQASQAAASLTQMAVRSAKGDAGLAALVRERQDLTGEWHLLDAQRVAAISEPLDKRNRETEAANAGRLAAIDARIAEIDALLKTGFPDYAALINPAPLSIADVQIGLRADEALVLFLDTPEAPPTPEETFVWVVTRTDARWVRSGLGSKALADKIALLRRSLDPASGTRAALAVGNANPNNGFDRGVAHELYKDLFGEIEDVIAGKQLLIVPSGPLTSLPFQVLVTRAPGESDTYRSVQWLLRRHALTMLPSVASLQAIRRLAGSSRAAKPFLGIGNPLLLGPSGDDQRAFAVKGCSSEPTPTNMTMADLAARGVSSFFRGNLADVAEVRRLAPLPETAQELCEVGRGLGGNEEAILLGAAATETAIKWLSASGRLAEHRVLHFATHGLVAGEIKQLAEPALVLTPPHSSSEDDDGLLTASEVAGLKLDADWVILSACNTAAGNQGDAQALSGLARAFFYAGARTLLVSHWPVHSAAAVKITTIAFQEMRKGTNTGAPIGRAEALRRAMLTLIDAGSLRESDPATWAPFVVVGEGGAG